MRNVPIAGFLFSGKTKTKKENVAGMRLGRDQASRLAEKTSVERYDGLKLLSNAAAVNSSKNSIVTDDYLNFVESLKSVTHLL